MASSRLAGAGHASVACDARAAACCGSSALGTRPVIARNFEGVKRGHTRAPLADFDGRETRRQTRRRGADGKPQLQLLEIAALDPAGQAGVDALPRVVEQQRIFARLLRKHPLGERRDEDDVEAAAAKLRGTATNTRPYRRDGGSASMLASRTGEDASGLVERTGPTAPSGEDRRARGARGRDRSRTRGASASKSSSHSAQGACTGHAASVRMIGSANAAR